MTTKKFNPWIEPILLLNSILKIEWDDLCARRGRKNAYLYRCVQADYQIRHSATILNMASENAAKAGDEKSANFFITHSLEEKDHYLWTENDLSVMRTLTEENEKLSDHIKELIEHQYQALSKGRYEEIYGYIIALEGIPGSALYWEKFATSSGISIAAFRSTILHAQSDITHSNELFLHLDSLSLSDKQKTNIIDHARTSLCHIIDVFR